MSEFSRTLETAADAEGISRLLARIAERSGPATFAEAERLSLLSDRYADYARSLRAMVANQPTEPEPDQVALL